MKMKKTFFALLTCTLLLMLAACAPAETKDDNNNNDDESNSPGTLVMATNATFPPYEYRKGGGYAGIDVEIAELIAGKLGMELEIMDVEFETIIASVQTGKADIGMAAMTATEDRLQNVNFSVSYATGVQVVITREDSDIKSVDDLFEGGYIIGVQTGTTGDLYATWDLEDEGLGKVSRLNTGTDAVMALTSSKVDCVIIDNEPAKAFVASNPGLKILDTEYAIEDYAICLAKENTELLDKINTTLGELINDGTVQEIIDKYISAE